MTRAWTAHPALPFIAAVVFGTVAMASVPATGWLDGATVEAQPIVPAQEPVPENAASPGQRAVTPRVRTRCAACGVVQAVRHIRAVGNMPESYEISVRLRDGTIRVSSEASPAKWREGDNVILIGGAESSDQ